MTVTDELDTLCEQAIAARRFDQPGHVTDRAVYDAGVLEILTTSFRWLLEDGIDQVRQDPAHLGDVELAAVTRAALAAPVAPTWLENIDDLLALGFLGFRCQVEGRLWHRMVRRSAFN